MKSLFIIIGISANLVAYSQTREYEPFKLGVGLGYAIPGQGASPGVLLFLEPMYRWDDNFAMGLRIEEARIYGTGHAAIRSYSLQFQYYFSKNEFRPFIGFGIGSFSGGMTSYDGRPLEVGGMPSTGYYPRIGFDYNHLNVTIDYNMIPASSQTTAFIFTMTENKPAMNYFAIRVGVSLGGGRKAVAP